MAYASWSVVFGEQPSASKWNILGTNDASFNDGTGIASGTITNSKLLLTGSSTAEIATSQTTTSTSYVDLATPGPAVTVTIGASGLALVSVTCTLSNSTASIASIMGFAVSGSTTVAASDTFAVFSRNAAAAADRKSAIYLVTSLTPGSNTFTAKYSVTANTGTFSNRKIIVIPL